MVVKASEVEELVDGNDIKFKSETAANRELQSAATGGSSRSSRSRGRHQQQENTTNVLPNSSHHLDAVPAGTPISRYSVGAKRVKTFPTCYDDHDMGAIHDAAKEKEVGLVSYVIS